ncbi:hypothetical protein RPSD_52260 (plasmid) [Ralstonia solanacearum]|nr:hypothetical protein RPSD_52260 [Ralstonia solanacearum]
MFNHDRIATMHTFCHVEDSTVKRENARAVLRNEEGEILLSVPDTWTDAQIKTALELANRAYAKGVEFGKALKALEIEACLSI